MTSQTFFLKYKFVIIVLFCVFVFLGYLFGKPLWEGIIQCYYLFSDREKVKIFIAAFGIGAPFAFMAIQILQVVLAPIPGEATGFIGGYIFGATKGFFYSCIGLSAGSLINFYIGRFLGKRYIRKLIPAAHLERFDLLVKHQSIFILFILFVFPGFPKDYLCIFLGLSLIPFKVFIVLAAIGRMPGTFMLNLQGAYLFQQMYLLSALIFGICIIIIILAYLYKDKLYNWIDRFNGK